MNAAARGVLFDYGGVLTGPVHGSFHPLEDAAGIPRGGAFELLVAASKTQDGGMIGALERGEMEVEAFDERMAELLRAEGYEVEPGGLLQGLFDALEPSGRMWEVVLQARDHGVTTGLLSNSWGLDGYPRERLAEHFDIEVISGEVGLRKPEPAIYRLACERAGLAPASFAFVDDLERNVQVAQDLGMFGVLHEGDEQATTQLLADFLEVDLRLV